MFVPRKEANIPPFYPNTRIYSCILIKNDIPYRWRGRYNEDTDLSLRALVDGWCTVLFNAFIIDKMTTMTMKGGNTDELYKDDGRLKMAESLKAQHPHLVKITRKWGRWQHHVNYDVFKRNKLKLKPGIVMPDGQNDYGMSLRLLEEQGGVNGENVVAQDSDTGAEASVARVDSTLAPGQNSGAESGDESESACDSTSEDARTAEEQRRE